MPPSQEIIAARPRLMSLLEKAWDNLKKKSGSSKLEGRMMATAEEKLTLYIDKLIDKLVGNRKLDLRARGALQRIVFEPSKLLALRGYIRHGEIKDEEWAWTEQQSDDFKKRREYKALMEAVKQVQNQFATANPEYTLRTNTKYRSLDTQINLWNKNDTVKNLGGVLIKKSLEEIADYPEIPTDESLTKFRKFLKTQDIGGSPSNATPGLSDHGHLDAFDFAVMKGSVIVAGTSTKNNYQRENWDKPGWTEKLKNIIETVNKNLKDGRFEGPLHVGRLYEPWHYTYISMTK